MSSVSARIVARPLVALAGMAAASGAAPASAGAAGPPAPSKDVGASNGRPSTGGVTYVEVPKVRRTTCVRRCGPAGQLKPGSIVRLRGTALRAVTRVTFHGQAGPSDDVTVGVRPRSDRRVGVRVPPTAVSGPVSASVARTGLRSALSVSLSIAGLAPASAPDGSPLTSVLRPVEPAGDPGAPRIETGLDRVKLYYGERGGVRFAYRVTGNEPVTVQVDLVSTQGGQVVQTWDAGAVPLGTAQTVVWRGKAAGVVVPDGRYAFRLTARSGGGAQARSSQAADSRDAFEFRRHIFPVRGRHDFGQAGARFGTGRAGHSHQGQDLFAACGTPLVAARGGVVKFRQYHAAAGHYLVIDGDGADLDYVYMHLQGPPPFGTGERVYTGQAIGAVGDSGNAAGCHLHFELWSAPGWYAGGRPFDPLPELKAWAATG
jgi:hypothetical protein